MGDEEEAQKSFKFGGGRLKHNATIMLSSREVRLAKLNGLPTTSASDTG
jgi:hypothetical protein